MADDNIIKIEVQFEDGTKGFAYLKDQSVKAGQDAAKGIGQGVASASKSIIAPFTLIAATISTVLASAFTGKAIHAAIEQEDAINQLNQSLARTGQFSHEASIAFQEFATALSENSRFSDEAIIKNAALLETIGKISVTALPRATQAATDLAAAYGIGLERAFEIVGKAAEGQIGLLSRLGIEVRKGRTDAETFANALKLIERSAGGAAAAELNTFSGSVARAGNAFNEFLEAIGNNIVKNPQVVGFIKGLSQVFTDLAKQIGKGDFFSTFISDTIKFGVTFAQVVNDFVIAPLVRIGEIGTVVFDAVKVAIQTVIAFVGNLGVGLGSLLNAVGVISDDTFGKITAFASSSEDVLTQFADDTKASLNSIGESDFSSKIAIQLQTISDSVNNTSVTTDAAIKNSSANIVKFSDSALAAFEKINKTFQSGIINVIVAGVSRIGASLAQGGSAFAGFAKQVLGIIGDMAIQIGATLLAIGLGIDALKLSLFTLTGAGAIAAGLALIAIGGLLKSLGGGEAGSVAGPSATVGGGAVGGTTEPATDFTGDQQAIQPKQQVVVNVQGNILNAKDTGQQLAESIQEYLDKNNGVLVTT